MTAYILDVIVQPEVDSMASVLAALSKRDDVMTAFTALTDSISGSLLTRPQESIEDFIQSLRRSVWEANGGYCKILVWVVYLDQAPRDFFDSTPEMLSEVSDG